VLEAVCLDDSSDCRVFPHARCPGHSLLKQHGENNQTFGNDLSLVWCFLYLQSFIYSVIYIVHLLKGNVIECVSSVNAVRKYPYTARRRNVKAFSCVYTLLHPTVRRKRHTVEHVVTVDIPIIPFTTTSVLYSANLVVTRSLVERVSLTWHNTR
jgi:hypothetical protein